MSTVSFLNIGMHGYINPTLPVVAGLARRGHTVTYHTSPAFAAQIEAAGAKVHQDHQSHVREAEAGTVDTELKIYPDRSHWTCIEPGWEEVADFALDWAAKERSRPQCSAAEGRLAAHEDR